MTELRTAVAPYRYRIPDVSVIDNMEGEVTTEPPLLIVEVLSPDDHWSDTHLRIADYQAMGVPCIWIVDPFARRAWIVDGDQTASEVLDGTLRARDLGIELPLVQVLPPTE